VGGLLLAAGGCSTSVITRVNGAGAGVAPPARIAILVPEDDGAPNDLLTRSMMEAAFAKKGYVVAADGDYVADFSLADRPAGIGISQAKTESWLSPSKKRAPFQSCQDRTHRLTVVVVDRKTGQTVYRGGAEEHHCRGTLAQSRDALVQAVVADVQQPKGEQQIPRSGKK
jgi:hypothetical protein